MAIWHDWYTKGSLLGSLYCFQLIFFFYSRVEIHQIFGLFFFWKFKKSKRYSEINWPLKCGPVITSCGHVMHAKCYQTMFENLVKQQQEE